MSVTVYNDGNEVFSGDVAEFLADNGNDEWLTEMCAGLESADRVEFAEISGEWVIERK